MEVRKPVQRLTSVKVEWMWNRAYQEIYERAKSLVKEDTSMKYYDVRKPLYLENDASGGGIGGALLQVRDNLNCRYNEAPDSTMLWPTVLASKSLSSMEQHYSNIEKEALRILHGLKKFHHYCFACEVHVIRDHKPLVVIMGNDVARLPQYMQQIILCIYQYRIETLYKTDPKLYIADWFSHHSNEENKERYKTQT